MNGEVSESEVVRHLLFHKSLLSEKNAGERIDEYLRIAKASAEGEHITIQDPLDRALALALELVIFERMNPWDIDLCRFASLYLERLRSRPEIDLVTAGRLLLMAWKILRMQSEDVRERIEPPPSPEPEDEWFGIEPPLGGDEAEEFTRQILLGPVPMEETIRHQGRRRVTLFELVQALEEARKEAELRLLLGAQREEERRRRKETLGTEVEHRVHREDQEKDLEEIWNRIAQRNGHPIAFREICGKTREEFVKALVSVLFLARENRIRIWQEDFPYGPIWLQNISQAREIPLRSWGRN